MALLLKCEGVAPHDANAAVAMLRNLRAVFINSEQGSVLLRMGAKPHVVAILSELSKYKNEYLRPRDAQSKAMVVADHMKELPSFRTVIEQEFKRAVATG
eukprot:Sspe_Gene.108685::Locus_87804_Transcript_1_1_Confidence_1.000_Length_797::g.108685::m.108685